MQSCHIGWFVWTRELMFKVIDAMKEEPLLWNSKHVHFKHRSKKNAALNRVAAQLQLPTEAVRQKMDVLKSSYHKNRRRLENQPANTEMRRLYKEIIRLMERFQDGGLSDMGP
ncbi:uncharacterized protein LOC128274832 [Anopheles cruzii]|uniref:uncharacterized protein LOC128274832 n=1 Tax=Anopheles cruzii TaxID=68878 RepID=UPI0022EC65C0|nr:uncharacterized protein LOC128274832 [Anopheles cruzii]